MSAPKMPEDFKGKYAKKSEYTNTNPREWTVKEIEWCLKLKEQGYSSKQIAESVERTQTSVSIKLKRLTKKDNTYNESHLEEKYKINEDFIELIKPKSILDVYCGKYSFYKTRFPKILTITNDIDEEIKSDYSMDALKFLCLKYSEGNTYDVVDLDPFGSAAECLDLAIKMSNKGLVVTLGEMGHVRWKRTDFVERFYGIRNLEDFNSNNIIKSIIEVGKKHKKNLIPVFKKDWKNISRVWFKIEKFKITKQWD